MAPEKLKDLPTIKNQMEEELEHEMEAALCRAFRGTMLCDYHYQWYSIIILRYL